MEMEYERSLGSGPALEHGSSRFGRWLRARRIRIAFWIAVAEGILIVFHAISWWAAVAIAALVVIGWFSLGHRLRFGLAGDQEHHPVGVGQRGQGQGDPRHERLMTGHGLEVPLSIRYGIDAGHPQAP